MELVHYHRFPFYDYSRGASLFVTVTTSPRQALFGRVVDAKMELSPFGAEVLAAIVFTFGKAAGFTLFGRAVLPDHVHFRFYLDPGLDNAKAIKLMNHVVGRFKSYTTHLYQTKYGGHGALWQEGFHDWLCLSREMIDSVERYIAYNALKWWLRNGGGRALMALHEPLRSSRLAGEFWRGVGAVGLLESPGAEAGLLKTTTPLGAGAAVGGARAAGGVARSAAGAGGVARPDTVAPPRATSRRLVALRVSRRCGPGEIAALVARLRAKAGALTVISGFISPGERAVFAALLAEPTARLVKVSPYALPHDYAPSVALMPAISEGRLAIIARGNSPEEISRAACLDLNAHIIDIADQAAYVLPGEIKWLK